MRSLLIVDDHEGFRSWAHEVLAREGFNVLGVAADGRAAIDAVDKLHPDVVLLDIQLPDMSGFDVAEQVAGRTTVVLTSSRSASDYGRRVTDSPAAGFVGKADITGATLTFAAFGGSA